MMRENIHSEHQSNAMTEIALVLAMAFFSILVLAMLSIGSVRKTETNVRSNLAEIVYIGSSTETDVETVEVRKVATEEVIIY